MVTRGAAYRVVHSSGTYGAATPYAVVSTASGMPQLPPHGTEEEAHGEAARLNAEAQHAAARVTAAAQRKAARLRVEALAREAAGEDEPA